MSLSFIHLDKKVVLILLLVACVWLMYTFSLNLSTSMERRINLHTLLEVAIKASENGGLEVVNRKDSFVIRSKGPMKEQVTTADFLSHCSMLTTLKHYFPNLWVISEEAETKCESDQVIDYKLDASLDDLPEKYVNENDIVVWIDPLDATREYTEKLFQYVTTMVCVSVKGKPVIGVIHNPFTKQTFWSWTGYARSSNLIHNNTSRDKLIIAISRLHNGEEVKDILNRHVKNFELIKTGGSGYKTLLVAIGQIDAYVHITASRKWDICAGNAILEAMGGSVTTKFNDPIDYSNTTGYKSENGLVASLSADIHDLFIEKL